MNHIDHNSSLLPTAKPQISIVVPAFNEETNLATLYAELIDILTSLNMPCEIIFVDDGSTDKTWEVITSLHKTDPCIKGLRLSRNFGHQHALLAGLSYAAGEVVITMDADLQHPPDLIQKLLLEHRKGNKVVHTVRLDTRKISLFKRITSKSFYKIFSFLSGVKIECGMADFRLLDRQVLNDILSLKEGGLFIRGLVQWIGYPSSKVEYQCRDRLSGQSKYKFSKMVKFAWTAITSFSIIPLRIAIILGFITSMVAVYQLIVAVHTKLFTDHAVPGWASVIGITSLLFGVLFIILGIIGEYIARILEELRGRPRFIVSNNVGFGTNTDAPDKSSNIESSIPG